MIDLTKRIFITWVTWFVGANLLHRLISLWANDLHVLIRDGSNLSRIDNIKDKVIFYKFSLENREETLQNIKEIQPQIIYHLAAAGTAVGRAPLGIDDLIRMNTLGLIHLIDAAVEIGCECFVNTGSSSEYGQKNAPMSEDDIIEPNNNYAISKATATQYVSFIGKQKLFPSVTFRLFSVYGPLEDQGRLIPTLVQNYKDWIVPQLSSPNSVRDFIYIDDVIDCFLEANRACKYNGDIFNIWIWSQYSIWEVVSILKQITSSTLDPVYWQKKVNQHEPKYWLANNEKMKTILGVYPRSLKEGLLQTIEW